MIDSVATDLMTWTPAGVVSDCDGLLVDTEPCWTVAEAELFGEPGTASAIEVELLALVADEVRRSAEPMAGAVDLVATVSRRVPVAVASSSPRQLLDAVLRRAGMGDGVQVTVAADEVRAGKPAPDLVGGYYGSW